VRIAIFGLGYVGSVSAACLAKLGHRIVGVDVQPEKVARFGEGEAPVLEPGLDELLAEAHSRGALRATTDATEAVETTDLALICVGTPSTRSGGVDGAALLRVCRRIGEALTREPRGFYAVLVRSTSLPPVHAAARRELEEASGRVPGDGVGYCVHPEFLREGEAVGDFFDPPKIVFGLSDRRTAALCEQLYPGLTARRFVTTPEVAAMIKYADNCFHAVKVTFANEMGLLCRELGVDSHRVAEVFVQDTKLNISPRYLRPGFAFGGSCLPKDLRAVLDAAREAALPLPMLGGTLESNRSQIDQLLARVLSPDRPRVGLVGLTFKEATDDVRESPMVQLVETLTGKGHPVRVYDASLSVARLVGGNRAFALRSIPHLAEILVPDLQQVIDDSDLLVVAHRLAPETWAAVELPRGLRVIDLVGVDALRDADGYEGLYW